MCSNGFSCICSSGLCRNGFRWSCWNGLSNPELELGFDNPELELALPQPNGGMPNGFDNPELELALPQPSMPGMNPAMPNCMAGSVAGTASAPSAAASASGGAAAVAFRFVFVRVIEAAGGVAGAACVGAPASKAGVPSVALRWRLASAASGVCDCRIMASAIVHAFSCSPSGPDNVIILLGQFDRWRIATVTPVAAVCETER